MIFLYGDCMSQPKPITVGAIYNEVTLLEEIEPHVQANGRSRRKVKVECSCGTVFDTMLENVYAGYTKSCGCLAVEHGMTGTDFKHVHTNMKARCDRENHPQYKDYGGRGITYDPRWSLFKNFMDDMYEGYSKGLTLDREDVDGNYTKENCRWVDMSVQGHNKRKKENCLFMYKGINYNLPKTRFVVRIKGFYLSTFDLLEDAAKAYDDASQLIFNDRPNNTEFNNDEIFEQIRSKLVSINLLKDNK